MVGGRRLRPYRDGMESIHVQLPEHTGRGAALYWQARDGGVAVLRVPLSQLPHQGTLS